MATVSSRGSGTPTTSGTTWATTTNAVDGAVGTNPATYATWTNATSGATGYIEISGHNFAASIGATDTINSVNVSIRTLVSNTGRISAVSFRPYDGGTPIDVVAGGTVTTTAHNNSYNFIVTAAQLRSATFRIRITFTHAANTQSGVGSVDYADVTVDYTPPQPSITQAAYQFFDDAGTEDTSVALGAQDTAITGNVTAGDGYGQMRFRMQATTAIAVPGTDVFTLQYEKNASGTWLDATSGAVVGYNSPTLTDGATMNRRLTVGTGSYAGGKISEVSSTTILGWTANDYVELLYSVRLVAAQLANGDTLRFRVARNSGTAGMTYTATPTINIISTPPQTWVGSTGTLGALGISGEFYQPPPLVEGGRATEADEVRVAEGGVARMLEGTYVPLPLTVPGLTAWFDGAHHASFLSVGAIDTWFDRSTYGRTMTQRVVANQPSREYPPGGSLAAVKFGPSLTYLDSTIPNNLKPTTVIAVLIHSEYDGTFQPFFGGAPNETGVLSGRMDNGNVVTWALPNVSGFAYDATARVPAPPTPFVTTLTWSGAGETYLSFQKVVRFGPHFVGSTPTPGQTLRIGGAGIGPSFKGYICEFLQFDRVVSDTERQQLEDHLMAKWLPPPVQTYPLTLPWSHVFWADDPQWTPPADGAGVPEWLNSGEYGHYFPTNAVQPTSANQPRFVAAYASLNNKSALTFRSPPSDALQGRDPSGSGPWVTQPNDLVFIGYQTAFTQQDRSIFDNEGGSPQRQLIRLNVGGTSTTAYAGAGPSVPVQPSGPFILIIRMDGTNSWMRLNGVQYAFPSTVGTMGSGAVGIGATTGSGNKYEGVLAFVGVLDTVLTAQQITDFETWASDYYLPPPALTWIGSTATIGVAGMSGAFVPGAVSWGGVISVLTSLWSHDAPMGTDSGSGDTDPLGVVLGTRVRFAEAGKVHGVWFQKGNTVNLNYTVSLWRQTGPGNADVTLLRSRVAPMGTGVGWMYVDFAAVDVGPLADISGDQMSYVVACHYPQDPAGGEQQLNYRSIASGFASGPVVNGSITAPQGDTNTNSGRNGRFIYTSTGASYPDNSFNFGNYLIDVEFGVLSGVASDVATIGVSGISGAFTATQPPQTWAGSTATAGVAALSGLLSPGAITWTGGATAFAGVTGISSALVAGTVIWNGSTATVGTAAISGEFSTPPPPQSWGGTSLPTLPITTGLQVWLDANTLTPGALTAWPNAGDGPEPIIVGTPAPEVRADTLNGLPVVRFKSSEGRLRGTSTVTTELTISYVVRRWGPSVGRCLTATYPGTAAFNYLVGYHTSSADWMYDNGEPTAATGWIGDQMNPPTAWRLYGSDGTTTPSYKSRFFIDGVQRGVDWPAGQGMGGTYNLSGYSATGVEETGDFEVAELVMYDRKLSDVERGQVEDYLRTKWFEPLELADTATLGIAGVTGEFSTFAPPQTWAGSTATVGAAGITGVFIGGPITWVSSSISTVGAAGISAAFVPGVIAWAGSTATSGAAGISGTLVPGTAPWAGSTATSGVSGVSGSFVPGAITWVSTSIATAGVAALTGAFVGGATTWAGSTATVGMAGAAGSWSAAGAPATWSGSIATIGTAGLTDVFVPGARTWVSSTAASGVTGVSGAFTSLYTWIGSNASLGGAGQLGAFVPGARTWASTFATVGVAGITGPLVPGPRTWEGSVATVGITALTRPFVPGAVVWVGSIATIGVAGESRVMSSGITAWWNGQEIVDMMWESTQVLDWVKT